MSHHQSLNESIAFFESIGLGAILQHTQSPHKEGDRHCATIEIGETVECPIRYAELVQCIIKEHPSLHAINKKSITYSPPTECIGEQITVDGAQLNKLSLFKEPNSLAMTTRIMQHSKPNKNLHITTETDELFAYSVTNQHEKLFPSGRHGDGYLFHRNGADKKANLFALADMNCILDDERHVYHSLMFSSNDFAEAKQDIKLSTHKNLHDCIEWENSATSTAAFIEPCGSGKSKTLKKVARLPTTTTHRIITQSMRASRHEFVEEVGEENIIEIYGNEEIALASSNSKHESKIKSAFTGYYEDEKAPSVSFEKFVTKELSFVDEDEREAMIEFHKENSINMKRRDLPLCMTHKKLELIASKCGEKYNPFSKSVIYSDEYITGTVADLPNQDHNPSIIRGMKRCYVSAESIALMEIKAWLPDVCVIGCGTRKQYDDGLHVVRVDSTKTGEVRDELFDLVSPRFGSENIIVNASKSKVNFTNNKGSSEWRNKDVCSIASYPEKKTTYKAMLCLRNDNFDEVESLLVMASVTQSLGRNMGFRNKSGTNKHLLIIPHHLAIPMEFITKHVYMTNDIDHVINKMDNLTNDVSLHMYLSNMNEGDAIPTKSIIDELMLISDEKSVNKKAGLLNLKVARKRVNGVKVQHITR